MPTTPPETPSPPHVRLRLAPRRDNVALVRHVLAGLADAGAVPPARMEQVLLAVSEAVTTIVERSHGPGEEMTVTGHVDGDRLVVAVAGAGRALTRDVDGPDASLSVPVIAALAGHVAMLDHGDAGAEMVMTFPLDG